MTYVLCMMLGAHIMCVGPAPDAQACFKAAAMHPLLYCTVEYPA